MDANWSPQDTSQPKPDKAYNDQELFKFPSVNGFISWMNGLIHWISKCQAITACSSAETEIYATDEYLKSLQHIIHILEDLDHEF
mmetsp:Transcript_6452/g.9374  ORF Transcript_6452/g.9374 Transcript_6452/m.9374 type:complete len:85 (-) Transcript_6452:396-650(-)